MTIPYVLTCVDHVILTKLCTCNVSYVLVHNAREKSSPSSATVDFEISSNLNVPLYRALNLTDADLCSALRLLTCREALRHIVFSSVHKRHNSCASHAEMFRSSFAVPGPDRRARISSLRRRDTATPAGRASSFCLFPFCSQFRTVSTLSALRLRWIEDHMSSQKLTTRIERWQERAGPRPRRRPSRVAGGEPAANCGTFSFEGLSC